MFPVEVKRGEVVQIKGGAVHHDSLIGKQYGSKVTHMCMSQISTT